MSAFVSALRSGPSLRCGLQLHHGPFLFTKSHTHIHGAPRPLHDKNVSSSPPSHRVTLQLLITPCRPFPPFPSFFETIYPFQLARATTVPLVYSIPAAVDRTSFSVHTSPIHTTPIKYTLLLLAPQTHHALTTPAIWRSDPPQPQSRRPQSSPCKYIRVKSISIHDLFTTMTSS